MAEKNRSTSAAGTKRQLITLDFRPHDVEEALCRLLDLYEAGELDGLVFAASMKRGSSDEPILFGSAGRLGDNQAEAIGAAVLLQHRLATDM